AAAASPRAAEPAPARRVLPARLVRAVWRAAAAAAAPKAAAAPAPAVPAAPPAKPAPQPKAPPPAAPAEATADPLATDALSAFQWGVQLGRERCGFSGLPVVMVFVDETFDRAALAACLADPVLAGPMAEFVGVLVDPADEASQKRRLRRSTELQVIVRGANGRFCGGLGAGFTCADLARLLTRVQRETLIRPVPSPAFARLLESPDLLSDLLARGERARAEKLVTFLKEFAGPDSAAALAAEGRLR
ncbi:MAG: hypothetical protein ACE5EF_10700, partial [Dehalococcoidia bacterium]